VTTQLLIYERATPITPGRHRDWSVVTGQDYSFARRLNSAPLVAAEIVTAAREHPIIFAGQGDAVAPAAVFGAREGENAFIGEDGKWLGRYVPAFLRRYPFVFSRSEDGETFTLCIDEEFSGLNQEGRGERLFDSAGERTRYLESVLAFTREYQAQFQRTQAFCRKLLDLDLLEPAEATFRAPDGAQSALTGFMTINRDKLKALSAETVAAMHQTDELDLCYAHLHSLANMTPLAERVFKAATPAEEPAPAES
jgi:hypothetical protein